MGFAEGIRLTANTVRLCGLVRPIYFAVEIDDELKPSSAAEPLSIHVVRGSRETTTAQLRHCSVAVAILPTSMAGRADAKPPASRAVSRIWRGGFFASNPRCVLCKPEAPSHN
jgi:hypothetical protein